MFTTGTRLGPYEVVAPLGAGGMGEVYRARDSRMSREVAVKILPASVTDDADRLKRFEREAQLAGGLNHPNLLTIHDVGVDGGTHFIVTELLDGTTLRDKTSAGPIPVRRAIDWGSQIAEGLAAAHERGVIHRDLKPENIFVTRDGRVKILDFGLAKEGGPMVRPSEASETEVKPLTHPGAVLGTVGYMSPEQVRGEDVDARSDIFALGAILYEMLSGRRAFHGKSSVDTMHAILHAEPPELSGSNPQVAPGLDRIITHCLEKDPERRFQSARDLAFDLNSISGSSTELIAPKRRMRRLATPLWIVAVIAAAASSWFASRATYHRPPPLFRRITFNSRGVSNAFFTADQQSVVYSGLSTVEASDIYVSSLAGGEMRPLGLPRAMVLSVSKNNELAVLLNSRFVGGFSFAGTLARVPLGGGAPRELAENVDWAEWAPSGDDLLILRTIAGKERIEWPIGNVLYETTGWISNPRISPDGQWVAFAEHPSIGGDDGAVVRLGRDRKTTVLTPSYSSVRGLAWARDGKEIWYTAEEPGGHRILWSVRPGGRPRIVAGAPADMILHDIAHDGRVLISETGDAIRLRFHDAAGRERDLSWLDWSLLRDMTPDGKRVLFDETGDGGGKRYSVYIRNTDGSPAVRLGEGVAMSLSPDGRSALAIHVDQPTQLWVYPTGAGQPFQLTHDALNHTFASWLPDGRSVAFNATEPGHSSRCYVQSVAGGAPRPVSPEGVFGPCTPSPDGRWIVARGPKGVPTLYGLQRNEQIELSELSTSQTCAGWGPSGPRFVLRNANPAPVVEVDLTTRHARPWKEIPLIDTPFGVLSMRFTPDGSAYAFSVPVTSSDLYLLEGAK